MGKRIFSVFIACCMIAAFIPAGARAADQTQVLENIILSLQADLQAADPDGELDPLTANTMILLDRLHGALKNNDAAGLTGMVEDYAASIEPMQDNQTSLTCTLPLLISIFGSTTTMLTTVSSGGETACIIIKLTNSVADIISAVQTYKICNIDNSATPDETLRAEIVQRQVIVKTYNFISSALYLGFCEQERTFMDYVSLFFDFIGIFPKEETEAAAL